MRFYIHHGSDAHSKKQYSRSKQAYEAALASSGPAAEETLLALLEMTRAAHQMNDTSECAALLKEALHSGAADDLPACRAGLLREYAAIRRADHDLDAAHQLLQEALAISKAQGLSGEYSPAEIHAEIALTYRWHGDFAHAAEAMTPAVEGYLAAYGEASEETLQALQFQVYMYLRAYDHTQALPAQKLACEVSENLYGNNADTRREKRRLEQLEACAEREQEILGITATEATRAVARLLKQFNKSFSEKSKEERLKLLEDAYTICQAHPEVDPLLAANIMEETGALLLASGAPGACSDSEEWLRRAIDAYRRIGDEARPQLLSSTRLLANLLRSTKRLEDALVCYDDLLAMVEQPGDKADALLRIASVKQELGELDQAARLYEDASKILQQYTDDSAIIMADTEENIADVLCDVHCDLAEIYISLERYDEAVEAAQSVLAAADVSDEEKDCHTFRAWRCLAIAHNRRGRHHAAYVCYLQTFAIDARLRYGCIASPRFARYEMALACWNAGLQEEARARLLEHLRSVDKEEPPISPHARKAASWIVDIIEASEKEHRLLVQHTIDLMSSADGSTPLLFPLHADLSAYGTDPLGGIDQKLTD